MMQDYNSFYLAPCETIRLGKNACISVEPTLKILANCTQNSGVPLLPFFPLKKYMANSEDYLY